MSRTLVKVGSCLILISPFFGLRAELAVLGLVFMIAGVIVWLGRRKVSR